MKVWRIRIVADVKEGKLMREITDKGKTYVAKFKYERTKKGNWAMTHDYATERIYSGIAPNIKSAMALALQCAKKDDIKNPEIIEIVRYGECDFGLDKKKKR